MATPFVQGRLRNQILKIDILTRCEHCDDPIRFSVDSQMRHVIHTTRAEPLVFKPRINWGEFSEPNIIHAY